MPEPCSWEEDRDEDHWVTGCDNAFYFVQGGPKENGCKFCPYCGGVIVVKVAPTLQTSDETTETK